MPSARAVNVKTDNPVLPPRFKAAVWVSPKGSGRRFLTVRIGTDAEGRGSTVEPTSAVDLDPEKARAWRSWEKHLARLYKDGAPGQDIEVGLTDSPPKRMAVTWVRLTKGQVWTQSRTRLSWAETSGL